MANRPAATPKRPPLHTRPVILSLVLLLLAACNATQATKKGAPTAKLSPTEQRQAWQRRLDWPTKHCPLNPPFEQDAGVTAHPFGDDGSLVEVTCTLGAYQGDSLLYLLDRDGKARALRFRQFHSPDKGQLRPYTDTLLTGIVQVTPERQSIKVWRKYRGIGDCGQLLRYRVSHGQAELIELRVRDCADEPAFTPPEQWPRVKPPAR